MFGPTPVNLRELRAASRRTADALSKATATAATKFSLAEYVVSQIPNGRMADRAAVDVAHAISHETRQQYGVSSDGLLIPFSVLARDLTTATAASAFTQQKGDALAQSLGAVPSIVGAGCTVLAGLKSGPVSLPIMDTPGDYAGGWVAENAVPTTLAPTFAVRTLTPKTLVAEMIVSRRLLLQSSVAVDVELKRELFRRVLLTIDAAIINGDGVNAPLGLLGDTAVETLAVGANGGAPTWAHICQLEEAVGNRTGQLSAPALIMHPSLRRKLRQVQRGASTDLILKDDDGAQTLVGASVRVTPQVPANITKGTGTNLTAMIYGDLSEVIVGFWGPAGIDLLVDPMTRSTTGAVRLIAHVEVGVVARYAGALSTFKDINPA